MKKIFYTSLLLLIVSCGTTQKWQLVWEDEFEQTDTFNETNWEKIPRWHPDWAKNMSDDDRLYDVIDGNLVLRGIVNTDLEKDTAPFLTGGVYTKDKVWFGNGRVEVRAKLQGAKGAWPAIWMKPRTVGWPQTGEIDIMERLNFDSIVYQTVHTAYTHHLGIKNNPPAGTIAPINPNDYNVYAVEKYADSLVFYVNSKRTFSYPRIATDKEGQYPFSDNDFYLLIDMQLGGSWVGKVNPADLPIEMWIDWVRYYKRKE